MYWIAAILLAPALFMMCRKPGLFQDSGFDPRLSGGEATVFDETSKAFGHQVTGLNERDEQVHELGDGAIGATFVRAPSTLNPGLGPIFSNVSCISCHHNDGKGSPTAGLVNSSLLIRLSLPGSDNFGGPRAVEGFGTQLQDLAVFGVQPEAKIEISYTEQAFSFPDGEMVNLRKPSYNLLNPYKPLPGNFQTSPRMAPPFFGLGLLQNIPEATLLSFADENDLDGDGISGRPNYVYDPVQRKMMLGRFGLKANVATLLTQVAGAYGQDMGVTNYVFPQESSLAQTQLDALHDDPELPDSILNAAVFYIKTLAVPARRNVLDPVATQGEKIFTQIQCAVCHKPTIQTGIDLTLKTISNQRIHPYTDLLLHDMGEGLADGRPDFQANEREWKTPALWGIGLFEKTNGIPFYLHDGRARTLEEAILWHGGEAENAKQAFIQLPSSERKALIKFLKSL